MQMIKFLMLHSYIVTPMFALTNLEKIKDARLKLSQGGVTVLWKITNYEQARGKLTTRLQNKLKVDLLALG